MSSDFILPAGERLRTAVLRVRRVGRLESVLGTAFAIAPGLVMTAAHVGLAARPEELVLDNGMGTNSFAVTARVPSPDESALDIALLHANVDADSILPCAAASYDRTPLISRGYSPAAPGRGGRELRFDPRGQAAARYAGINRAYKIENAYELAGDVVEEGFSGSPLFDVAVGAVVGMITAGDPERDRTWAVPLRDADADWPELRAALAWNDRHMPRFGRLTNANGARRACTLASEAAVLRMSRAGKFNPDRNVPRDVADVATNFLNQSFPLMAIVGGSNSGKSWLMCDLARSGGTARLLLLAHDLRRNDPPSLGDFATEALRAAWPQGQDFPSPPDAAEVVAAFQAAGEQVTLFLDGLNEALGVPGLLRDWWPDGVAWVRGANARLIFTTRPERWEAIVRAIPDAKELMFDPYGTSGDAKVTSETMGEPVLRAPAAPAQRALTLADFSPMEASFARKVYGIHPSLDRLLGRHPLMFRIASDLDLTEGGSDLGRYRLIDDFVTRYVDEALDRLQRGSKSALLARVRQIARSLSSDDGGAIPLGVARECAGDDATLDALISVGLLIEAGRGKAGRAEELRFAFDEVAEAMRPVTETPQNLFVVRREGGDDFRQDAVALLRLEADGLDDLYKAAFEQLIDLIGTDHHLRDRLLLGEAANHIASALPPLRMDEIIAIFAALARTASAMVGHRMFRHLVDWISDAPLSPGHRTSLLLQIAPWSNVWPLRRKDWVDPARRPSFEQEIRSRRGNVPLAACLAELLSGHPDEVRPHLLNALSDDRSVDKGQSDDARGEMKVKSIAAAVLFHRRHDDFAGLLECLLKSKEEAADWVLTAIADADSAELCDIILPMMSVEAAAAGGIAAIRRIGDRLDQGRRAAVVNALEKILAAHGPDTHEAAFALAAISPGHLGSWSHLVRAVAAGTANRFDLPTVTSERFCDAMKLAEARPDEGLGWMPDYDGPEHEQASMVSLISDIVRTGRALDQVKWIVIHKIPYFARPGGGHHRPWIAVAEMLARNFPDFREPVIVSTFANANFVARPELGALAEVLVDIAQSEKDISSMSERLVLSADESGGAWVPLFVRARHTRAEEADRIAASTLCRTGSNAAGTELLACWAGLPRGELSELARRLLEYQRDGMTPSEIFSFEQLVEILN